MNDWIYEKALDFEWRFGVPLASVISFLSIIISAIAIIVALVWV
jgi:hypothetical protein